MWEDQIGSAMTHSKEMGLDSHYKGRNYMISLTFQTFSQTALQGKDWGGGESKNGIGETNYEETAGV